MIRRKHTRFLTVAFFSLILQHTTNKRLSTQPHIHSLYKHLMAATLSVRPNRLSAGSTFPRPSPFRLLSSTHLSSLKTAKTTDLFRGVTVLSRRASAGVARANSRADDSASFEMSVENALKLLGVSETASFDDILRAKNSIIANFKDDQEAIAQVLVYQSPLWFFLLLWI